MAKSYKTQVINSGKNGGTRLTVTRSSDGSIRTSSSSGPSWARTTVSSKNGRITTTKSSTINGWRTKSSSTQPNSYFKKPRKYNRRSKVTKFDLYVYIAIIVILVMI